LELLSFLFHNTLGLILILLKTCDLISKKEKPFSIQMDKAVNKINVGLAPTWEHLTLHQDLSIYMHVY
jgi:hypothetical protein